MSNSIAADAKFWNAIARKYAKDPIADLAGYERTVARTREFLGTRDRVLEFGCGTGTTALKLAPFVGRITATDFSSEMIAIAREKAAAQSCTNAEFMVSDLVSAPWPDAAFDAVLAFNVLHLMSDRREVLASVRRLLKPGGLFISKTTCLKEMNPLIRLAVPVMRAVGKAPYVAFFSAPELAAELEAAGFTLEERARHGSKRKDSRIFLVARNGATPAT